MSQPATSLVAPRVFISSTVLDLKPYREQARDAVLAADCLPKMLEYFPSGNNPPLDACLDFVSQCNVLFVIVAYRYGWVPADQPGKGQRSITWLECERALVEGKQVRAFLLDEQQTWPDEFRDDYELTATLRAKKKLDRKLVARVQRDLDRLAEFKTWLNARAITARFATPSELRAKVGEALYDWLKAHPHLGVTLSEKPPGDPGRYLRTLLADSATIDIRGLAVGAGKVYRMPIERLYVPLRSFSGAGRLDSLGRGPKAAPEEFAPLAPLRGEGLGVRGGKSRRKHPSPPAPLPEAGRGEHVLQPGPLEHVFQPSPLERVFCDTRPTVIVGDPGAGKTTFLRRLTAAVCRVWLEDDVGAITWLGSLAGTADERPFPLLIRAAELATHVRHVLGNASAAPHPTTDDSPDWLAHFLAHTPLNAGSGLDEPFFRQKLAGPCLLLIDGLDEAPDDRWRAALGRLLTHAARAHPRAQVIVTCRPAATENLDVLAGFDHARIEPFDDPGVQSFLTSWCELLYPDQPADAQRHRDDLAAALRGKPEIARLARNPVMLTALAVVHWNERRLPEQRAELYESIIKWLARAREQRPGRPPAQRAEAILAELALAMQTAPGGRLTQVPKRWAAESLAAEFAAEFRGGPVPPAKDLLARAEQFLSAEELDSGIIVGRGNEIRFWHLTFQEYLAAKAIAARPDEEQRTLLLRTPSLFFQPEWREVLWLLAGVLLDQGRPKVDGLIGLILDQLGDEAELPDQARAAGLLGGMLRDLAASKYTTTDPRWPKLLDTVMAIFDRQRSRQVPLPARIAAADALGQAGDPRLEPRPWIALDGGTFSMGATKADDPDAYDSESPVHQVTLAPFRIARYPVTVGEFRLFIEHEGYDKEPWWTAGGFGQFREPENWEKQTAFPSRPVVGVSWFEAMAYCAWAGVSLPTEAQWEFAARGTTGRRYPWGSEEPDEFRANYGWQLGHPTPVGLYPEGETPEGISDLAGNVWEWCLDWYGDYPSKAVKDPVGPKKGEARVVRGGSWGDRLDFVRAAVRLRYSPGLRSSGLGFRVCGLCVASRTR